MDGNFELNKPGWYKVLNSQTNDFLNEKLESEQYGIYYSVRFDGDAETYLWQAKSAPVEGEKYYGHIEETKSGKSMRFKKDKLPEGETPPAGASPTQSAPVYQNNSKGITLGLVWKIVAGINGLPDPADQEDFAKFFSIVQAHTNELLSINDKLNKGE